MRFLKLLSTLIGLRYRLIWAHARTSGGRIALLFALYLLGALAALFFSLGGFGAAAAGVQTGRSEEIARGWLSGLFASGIMISLIFGLGPRGAFSEPVLRRYPLTTAARLAARHLAGLLDPVWLLWTAAALGLAAGLAALGAGALWTGIAAALIFIAASYLATTALLSLIDRILRTGAGTTALGVVLLGLLSFSGLGLVWLLDPRRSHLLAMLDRAVAWAPPGLAARLMAGAGSASDVLLLILWCAGLLAVVALIERWPARHRSSVAEEIDWENGYDRAARLFGSMQSPLVGKFLRYYLRSNRVRFGLATTPVFAFIGRFLPTIEGGGGGFYFALSFFTFLGFSGVSSMALNLFGADEAGVRRYGILPVPFGAAVRAGSLAALLLGVPATIATIALWSVVTPGEVDYRMVLWLVSSSTIGLFFYHALSVWTTVLSPRRTNFTSILGNQLSAGGNLVIMGGLVVAFALQFALQTFSLAALLAHWWVGLVASVVSAVFYLVSLRMVGPVAARRRERLINMLG